METLKRLLAFFVRSDAGWFFLRPFSRLGAYMLRVRNEMEQSRRVLTEESFHEQLFDHAFGDRRVLHGPFTGMQYPSYNAIGSALYPKLLGCYERELHETIEKIARTDFSEIINIGCGEGYYAIGLARKFPQAKVIACDVDAHALVLCRQMAALNNVSDRMAFQSAITAADLKRFAFSERALIVCDCEGFEKELFDSSNLESLRRCHLLIEIHDFIDIEISSVLTRLFSATHKLEVIKSIDDIEKARTYPYEETRDLDLATKKKLLGERRPAIMEWFYLTPAES